MERRRTKKHMARGRRAAALLALFLCLLAFAPAVQAAPNAQCAAGRHPYAETRRVAATDTQDGEVTYVCGVCGQQYTEILYAAGHLWEQWITDRQPTCTQPGEQHRTCARASCHDEYAEIPALGHEYIGSVTAGPGCETQGTQTFRCSRCGDVYTSPVPALGGHSFGEWTVEIPAGEGVQGLEARVCARDGFRETRQLAALPVRPAPFPVLDTILVGANIGLLVFFSALVIPYCLCLLYIKKRRKAVARRDTLRKEVRERYGFQ